MTELSPRKRDDDAVRHFVERFSAAMVDAGIPRMPARVFVILLSTDSGRLTAAELAEQLQVSPAAISGAVRYLIQVDLIIRGRDPGSRRDQFQVHNNLWYEVLGRRDNVLVRWENNLREGMALFGASPAGDRMAETLAFFEFTRKELAEMLARWRLQRDELIQAQLAVLGRGDTDDSAERFGAAGG